MKFDSTNTLKPIRVHVRPAVGLYPDEVLEKHMRTKRQWSTSG